jgi:hypothetical protein
VTTELVINTVNLRTEEEQQHINRQIDSSQEFLPEVTYAPEGEVIERPSTIAETADAELTHTQPETEEQIDEEEVLEAEKEPVRRSARIAAGVKPPEKLTLHTKINQNKWQEMETEKAIEAELKQLFEELDALQPVKAVEVPKGTNVLRSHMFVVEKLKADGSFDKMKARLVADGRGQDPEMYPDKASPTIAVHSVFAILALCTGIRTLHMAKVDIKGAFVQTPMKGPPVYMFIDKKIVQYIIHLYPFYKQFVTESGSMVMKLLKAM